MRHKYSWNFVYLVGCFQVAFLSTSAASPPCELNFFSVTEFCVPKKKTKGLLVATEGADGINLKSRNHFMVSEFGASTEKSESLMGFELRVCADESDPTAMCSVFCC